jgi:hypothetical protein
LPRDDHLLDPLPVFLLHLLDDLNALKILDHELAIVSERVLFALDHGSFRLRALVSPAAGRRR